MYKNLYGIFGNLTQEVAKHSYCGQASWLSGMLLSGTMLVDHKLLSHNKRRWATHATYAQLANLGEISHGEHL